MDMGETVSRTERSGAKPPRERDAAVLAATDRSYRKWL